MKAEMLPALIDLQGQWDGMPTLVTQAGGNARFAWDEMFRCKSGTRTLGEPTAMPCVSFWPGARHLRQS